MPNFCAAIGLVQIKKVDEFIRRRREICQLYDAAFSDLEIVRPLSINYAEVAPHIYVVRIQGLSDRKALQTKLLEQGIQTGIHYQPNHGLSLYRDTAALPLPVTDAVFQELLTLPLHPDLTEQDVEFISRHLKALVP